MDIKKVVVSFWLFGTMGMVSAQTLRGTVFEYNNSEQLVPLEYASIQWLGTSVGTITNAKGAFEIPFQSNTNKLVIHFVGYQSDTLEIKKGDNNIRIVLSGARELESVKISASDGMYISAKPILTQVITMDGLRKAACCNLSESFESSISVDVSYSDAVTGAKQIQMLGLAGIYSQIMLENTPYIRGLSTPFGLMYVPGSWMESINVSKGTASVINGYESITGQIDVNYKKPETNKEKLFLNLFLNTELKSELNLNTRFAVTENASTMFLFHFENQALKLDHNDDGFLDMPLSTQVNVMNRWDYEKHGKMEGRTMISYLYDTRTGGQTDFSRSQVRDNQHPYGIGVDNHKFNLITKNGILLKGEHESIGTIASFSFHKFNSFYGLTDYETEQISGYANAFYENFVDKKEQHKIDAGLSYQIDAYKENFNDLISNRLESVPGIFGQYSFIFKEKFVAIAGMRLDYNSLYGLFWTPRLHAKWAVTEKTSIRITGGKGYRSPNVLIENTSLLASSRRFVISNGLKAEEAWNTGISLTQTFKIKNKECSFILDYFYTDFVNQVIVDMYKDFRSVYFYNLAGKSYSHSTQAELILYPYKGFEITAAYRYNLVKETVDGKLREKLLSSRHKAVLNISYATKFEKWKFNITGQFHGSKSLYPTGINETKSPNYLTFNAQITKKFKHIEIYAGVENFTNYKQPNPIIDPENPFGDNFDASMIWGPITGAMGYMGLRLTLK
ncbi:MAG: TonB-dependent receptor [Lentimicrobiaceae bacterium]|nr:TonB-dependent receptor [Lentimicrobiaceae bacterium]